MGAGRAKNAAVSAAALALSFLFLPPAAAQEKAPAPELSLGGWVAPSVYGRPSEAASLAFAGLRGALTLDGKALGGGLRVSAEGYSNFAGIADSADWKIVFPYPLALSATGNSRLLAAFDLKEAWFETASGALDLRFGKQILAWGLADGSNPTDTINARHVGTRLVSTLDEQKMGTIALDAVYNIPGNLGTIQALFMPISIPNDLPSMAMDLTVPGAAPGAPATRIVIKDDETPAVALENVEGGLRGLFYAGGLSFSASWLTILDRYPDYTYRSVATPPFGMPTLVTTTLTPVHGRVQQFGLDAALFALGFDFRSEWALTLTKDLAGDMPAIRNSSVSGVVQASRNYLDGALTGSLAWAPRFVIGHRAIADYPTAADRYLAAMLAQYDGQAYDQEHVLSARVSGKFVNETLQGEALFLAGLRAGDWLASASVSHNLADGLNLKAGLAFYGSFRAEGDIEREYGTFSNKRTIDKDYLFVELRWSL